MTAPTLAAITASRMHVTTVTRDGFTLSASSKDGDAPCVMEAMEMVHQLLTGFGYNPDNVAEVMIIQGQQYIPEDPTQEGNHESN